MPTSETGHDDQADLATPDVPALLAQLRAELEAAPTLAMAAAVVLRLGPALLGATSALIATVASDRMHLEIVDVGDVAADAITPWRRFPLSAPVPLADAVVREQPIIFESRREWTAQYSHMRGDLERTGHHATIVMPITRHGLILGVMGIAYDAPQRIDDARRALAAWLADSIADVYGRLGLSA